MSVDLTTEYLGLSLANPIIASASPLTGDYEQLIQLEEAGAAAVVLPSLFEETIRHEETEVARLYDFQSQVSAESLSYFPELPRYNLGTDRYLMLLKHAKSGLSIPVIASLNGCSNGGWVRYAKELQAHGADALELNIYFLPTDPHESTESVELRYLQLITEVRAAITIPLAVKIGPYFTNLAYTARRMIEAGADGLVLFNRYLEPDIDLKTMHVEPKLVLSTSHELRLPLRWLAILSSQTNVSLAATSGIHTVSDLVKAILAGAHVGMLASVLLKRGPAHIAELLEGLRNWLAEHEYASIAQMTGSMNRANCPNTSAFERANYTKALVSFTEHIE
jgi:dihydroorotate dehydrogenase (fumarate)